MALVCSGRAKQAKGIQGRAPPACEEQLELLQPAGKTRERLNFLVKSHLEKTGLVDSSQPACGLCCPLLATGGTSSPWAGYQEEFSKPGLWPVPLQLRPTAAASKVGNQHSHPDLGGGMTVISIDPPCQSCPQRLANAAASCLSIPGAHPTWTRIPVSP